MKNLKLTYWLFILLAFVSSARATIDVKPDQTFAWNSFNSVLVMNDYIAALNKDGLQILQYNSETEKFDAVSQMFLDTPPYTQKLSGNILVIRSTADILYFVNVGSLPSIQLLGEADIGMPFEDFALRGQDLYIAAGYEGVKRYSMVNYKYLTFADSSMVGIHCTGVEIDGTEMYVLDDYNGLMRYDISTIGFGEFREFLYIPYRVNRFIKQGDKFIFSSNREKLLVGQFGQNPPVTSDTINLSITPNNLLVFDTLAVVMDSSQAIAEMINLNSFDKFQFQLTMTPDARFDGDVILLNNEKHIIIPSIREGLALYNLDEIFLNPNSMIGLPRPGPITDIAFNNERLYTSGTQNPIDLYSISMDGTPEYNKSIFGNVINVNALDLKGNILCGFYENFNSVLFFNMESVTPNFLFSVSTGIDSVKKMIYDDHKFDDSLRLLLIANDKKIKGFSVSDSLTVSTAFEIDILNGILDFTIKDSLLVVSSGKSTFWVYRIYDDLELEFRKIVGLPFNAYSIVPFEDRLIVFSSNLLLMYDISDPLNIRMDTTMNIPLPVSDAVIEGDRLFTVGERGLSVFDLTSGYPELIDYGGRDGYIIAARDYLVAISNGISIHLYDLHGAITDVEDGTEDNLLPNNFSLAQNYPNPFNPTTIIEFNLPSAGQVELAVFNILGQKVNTLVNEERAAGTHEVVWDGRSESGRRVASGVYFYRLNVKDKFIDTKKMLLLK